MEAAPPSVAPSRPPAQNGAVRPEDLAGWPGKHRRQPRFSDRWYLTLSAITSSLAEARDRYLTQPVSILDIGCGEMPYYPLFASVAGEYAGADLTPGPGIRYICPAEALTVPDAAFDVALSTQVLEHVEDPHKTLREMARVVRPGGHIFLTTHGVWPFHPMPDDYWRWTQQGLRKIVDETPGLEVVEVTPHRGTASCLAVCLNTAMPNFLRICHLGLLARPLVSLVNGMGLLGDRLSRRLWYPRYPNPDTLIATFLVVARRTA